MALALHCLTFIQIAFFFLTRKSAAIEAISKGRAQTAIHTSLYRSFRQYINLNGYHTHTHTML